LIRAAIAGLGRWGQNLVNSVQGTSERIRFVRGVVRHPEKVAEFAQHQGLAMGSDLGAALADPQVDAIVLATPNSGHASEIIAAARAGKAVYCEKPLALTLADAERAVAACDKAGVALAVGQDKRFWPSMRELKSVAESGALGELLHVEGHFSNENRRQYQSNWRESPAESPGGSLTATGIHPLDSFIHLLGPATRVQTQWLRRPGEPQPRDTLSVLLEFANGASGVLCGVRTTPLFWRVHLFGGERSAEAISPDELVIRTAGAEPERRRFEPSDALRYELEAFADAAEGRAPFPIPVSQMLDVIAAMEAIVVSLETGAPAEVRR